MTYTICVNRPGYLPEMDPYTVDDLDAARKAVHEEIGRSYESDHAPLDAEWAALHNAADDLTIGTADMGEVGDRLTDAATQSGESDLYVGDDGRVYVTPMVRGQV